MGFFDGIGGIMSAMNPVGVLGTAVSMAGNIMNYNSQRDANQANIEQADKQMQFQKMMSDTAHQREVADLQAAGLNPILAAGGNGSSTPSGAAAPIQAPKIELPDLLAYGVSLKQMEQVDQKIAIDKANSAANIAHTLSETDLNKMKKILYNKGMIKAELEGEGAEVLRHIIKWIKGSTRQAPKFIEKNPSSFQQPYNVP